MITLKELRRKIDALERDASLDGRPVRESGDTAVWREAMRSGEILFSDGINGRVRYKSFRDIDFTGPEFQNQEWCSQLNRFFWLQPLAGLYRETGDERWARMARDGIEAWMDFRHYTGHETAADVWPSTGDNTLSTSIRLGQRGGKGWWGCAADFDGSEAFSQDFVDRMERSTYEQLHFLYSNNRKVGNWRVSELDTMFFLSQLLPGAEKYLPYAVQCINETFRTQVETDGSHVEHTPGYHDWMAEVFTRYALIAHRRPELGLCIEPEKLLAMWDFTIAGKAPDGRGIGIGDAERWHPDFAPADMDRLRQTRDALARTLGAAAGDGKPGNAFPDAGQYFLRGGQTEFILDATNFGGWHSHPARGAILCYHGDRLQLCDPGSLNYEHSDPLMAPGRGTPMHNTVTVGGMMQQPQADAVVRNFTDCADYAFFRCLYTGGYTNYRPGLDGGVRPEDILSVAGRHTRTFFWRKGHFAVVIDSLDVLAPGYDFAAHWQFREDGAAFDAARLRMHTENARWNVGVACVLAEEPVRAVRYEGDMEHKLGFVAKGASMLAGGEPAPMLSVEGHVSGRTKTRLVHVIVPYEGEAMPETAASWELVDGALQAEITVGGEKLLLAADLRFLDGECESTLIGFQGRVQSDRQFAAVFDDLRAEI